MKISFSQEVSNATIISFNKIKLTRYTTIV